MVDANRIQLNAPEVTHEPAAVWADTVRPDEAEWAFDDLLELAAGICDAPLAVLTLLGPRGECNPLVAGWWGGHHDRQAAIVALADAVSRHGDTVVVPDLAADPRHGDAPAVADEPGIRACAGVALVCAEGRRLGALSVLDLEPRRFTTAQMQRLHRLAGQLATLLSAPRLRQDLDRLELSTRVSGDDQHARLTLRSLGDGVVTMDPAGRMTFINVLAEHLTGWTQAEALGKRLNQVVTLKDEGGQPYAVPELESSGFAASPLTARTVLVRRDGHEISIEGTFAPMVADDRSLVGTVLAFRNVTVARKVAAELSHQATHDPLTGLANRRVLEKRIVQALKNVDVGGSGHALLYLDLDQFKAVNDTAGHLAGDELLRQLSGLLKQHLRESDILARLGGDEFGVLLENCDAEHAQIVAEKLRATVQQYAFAWKGRAFELGVSIGLVNIRDRSLTLTDILSRADESCYAAKAEGRNRVHVYSPDERAQAEHHNEQEWVREIGAALREGRMFLCSQPVVPAASRGEDATASAHQEVLLRLRAANGAIVPPMAFLPAAERHQLMPMIDRWVAGTVLDTLDQRRDQRYAINLSGATLLDESFLQFLRERIQSLGVPAQQLCFEVDERVVVANLARATEFAAQLRRIGCRVAIDGFGSGMSSFSYLKRLKVDYLKIDGALVQGVVNDPVQYAMVESINRIGQLMRVRTVAQFVEDEATREAMRAIGVDYVQGFGVGRPQPLGDPPT